MKRAFGWIASVVVVAFVAIYGPRFWEEAGSVCDASEKIWLRKVVADDSLPMTVRLGLRTFGSQAQSAVAGKLGQTVVAMNYPDWPAPVACSVGYWWIWTNYPSFARQFHPSELIADIRKLSGM